MSKVYKSLCTELDEVSVKILRQSEKLISYKIELEKKLSGGYVNMAKARYLMGQKNVGKLQIPKAPMDDFYETDFRNIKPISTVCRAEYKDHWVYKIHRKELKSQSTSKSGRESVSEETTTSEESNQSSNVTDGSSQTGSESKSSEEESSTESSLTAEKIQETGSYYADPIKWFGVLVPQVLKLSQQTFIESLKLVGNIATLQSELNHLIIRCKHLTNVKRIVEIAADKYDFDIYSEFSRRSTNDESEIAVSQLERDRHKSLSTFGSWSYTGKISFKSSSKSDEIPEVDQKHDIDDQLNFESGDLVYTEEM